MDQDWRLKDRFSVSLSPHIGATEDAGRATLVSLISLTQKKTLTIPVPNLTALYISNAQKNWDAYWSLRKTQKIDSSIKSEVRFQDDTSAFDAIEFMATSVVSAYSAIESFCNDSIPEDHEYWHNRKSDLILEKSDKDGIERHFSTTAKLNEILPNIYNVEQPKGKNPVWMSYCSLKKIRDSLIHAKSRETRSVGTEVENLWDSLFKLRKPHLLAKDVFSWYLSNSSQAPSWYLNYPK